MILIAALFALVSVLFCFILHKTEHFYERLIKNQYLRILTSGVLILILSAVLGTGEYLGSGMGIIEGILHHGEPTKFYTFF